VFRRGAEICEQLGDRWEHSIALYNLAETLLGSGASAEALRHLDRADAEKRAIGDRWGLGYVHYARARAELARKRPKAALAEASAGLELALGIRDPKLLALLNLALARAHQAGGDLAGAERALRFALASARRCASRAEMIEAHLALASAHLLQGRPAAAQRAAHRARTLASRIGAGPAVQSAAALLERLRRP